MRQTKIVGTIGPASEHPEVFRKALEAGLNVCRFNFSHGTQQTHKKNMDMVKEIREELDLPIAIMLDTKGPEIRVKTMKEGVFLQDGSELVLTAGDFIGDEKRVPITYEDLYKDVNVGGQLLISDGKIVLRVTNIVGQEIHTLVEHGGELKTRKGMNAPGIRVNLPAVTEQDKQDILFGIKEGVDYLAASFIRKAADVLEIRKILEENRGQGIKIISKIENREGLENLEDILEVSDGIMVARGDLGMEMLIEDVPGAQKDMIRLCNYVGKPVITATQMLESMTTNPLPTRAEATDVANAILDGTDAIMLSGEMAAGQYPVESVAMMDRIARATEAKIDFGELLRDKQSALDLDNVTYAVSRATVLSAYNLHAKAILVATSSGFTAEKIAMHMPNCPVLAGTTNERVRRQLSLVRGVYPRMIQEGKTLDSVFKALEDMAVKTGIVEEGDLVIISSGVPVGVSGATNTMKVHLVGEVTLKGTGIGKKKHFGTVRIVNKDSDLFEEGEILVAHSIDESMVDMLNRAGALITVEGGYTSLGAIAAVNLNIPAIVGVEYAEKLLRDGMKVTVDARLGLIYNSKKGIS